MEYETVNQIINIYQKHNKSNEKNEELFNALMEMYELGYEKGEHDHRDRFYVNEYYPSGKEDLLERCHSNNKYDLNKIENED